MQRHAETIEIDGQTVTISELTTGEVRALLKSLATTIHDGGFDAVDFELFPGVDLITVRRMIEPTDLDAWTPSQLERIIEKCRLVNPHFFAMRDRMMEAGRKIQEARAVPLNALLPS